MIIYCKKRRTKKKGVSLELFLLVKSPIIKIFFFIIFSVIS